MSYSFFREYDYRDGLRRADIAENWRAIARARKRAGDEEGARRALANAGALRALRQFSFGNGCAVTEKIVTIHLDTGKKVACGYRAPDSDITDDCEKVTCGNCQKTRAYRAIQEAA